MAGQMSLKIIYDAVDAALSQGIGDKPVSCGPGCSACCTQLVWLTLGEASALVDTYHAKIESLRPLLVAQTQRLMANADPVAWFGTPCVLLAPDGRCSVYENRPLVCRSLLVASPPQECGKANGTVTKYQTKSVIEGALQAAMRMRSEPHGALPFPMALLTALDYSGPPDASPSQPPQSST